MDFACTHVRTMRLCLGVAATHRHPSSTRCAIPGQSMSRSQIDRSCAIPQSTSPRRDRGEIDARLARSMRDQRDQREISEIDARSARSTRDQHEIDALGTAASARCHLTTSPATADGGHTSSANTSGSSLGFDSHFMVRQSFHYRPLEIPAGCPPPPSPSLP